MVRDTTTVEPFAIDNIQAAEHGEDHAAEAHAIDALRNQICGSIAYTRSVLFLTPLTRMDQGAKIRVENLHYDLTEDDIEVRRSKWWLRAHTEIFRRLCSHALLLSPTLY
jgi:hypothetical protein